MPNSHLRRQALEQTYIAAEDVTAEKNETRVDSEIQLKNNHTGILAAKRSFDERLDSDLDPPFCPVRGHDPRQDTSSELMQRRPGLFLIKFLLAYGMIGGFTSLIILGFGYVYTTMSIIGLGLMYAHLIELQHECLHRHAFNSTRWSNIFGFLCGIPMLSSHSHYRHDHLRHHAFIGTDKNIEFFNYKLNNLDSLIGFLRGACHMSRYMDVFRDTFISLFGGSLQGASNNTVEASISNKAIRREYRLYFILISAAITYSALTLDPIFLYIWLFPLFIGEPAHFMIELPEHFGLNTQSDGHVFSNTRTIKAGWLGYWYTNGNNLHTAHHYHQGVPMVQIANLHKEIEGRLEEVEDSYWTFYKKVIRGTLQNNPENCMTR